MPTPQPARKPAAKKPATSAKPVPHAAAKPAEKKAPVKRASPARSTATKVPAKTAAAKAPARRAAAPPAPSLTETARRLRTDNFNQPVTVLTAPWEERGVLTAFGAKWNADVRQFLVWGPVRSELTRYASKPMSWERWIEDEINGRVKPIPSAKVPMKPRPHQAVAVRDIARAASEGWRGYAEADSVGLGKALQSSTLIPTSNGFRTMGDLQVGDEVLSASGKPTRVLAKYLSHAKKFYRITFSDGEQVDADEDHRWLTTNDVERNRVRLGTRTRNRLSEKALANLQTFLLDAQEKSLGVTHRNCYDASLQENEGFITAITRASLKPVGEVFIRKDKAAALFHPQEVLEQLQKRLVQGNKWGTTAEQESVKTTAEIYSTQHIGGPDKYDPPRSNHRIALASAIEGVEQQLVVDPYLFGAWLGDGSSHNGGLTSMDDYIVSRFKNKYDLQRVVSKNESNQASDYFFKNFRSDLGKVYSGPHQNKLKKTIPNAYLAASKEQRFELLKGLLDTDGSITQSDLHGGVSFSQKDPELFFQVYSLICSLGFKATWRSREIGIEYKGQMRVGIYYDLLFYPNEQVFALPRKAQLLEARLPDFRANAKRHSARSIIKVEEIAKEGEYYCISVDSPDHLYLCTKSYIPTHNTLTSILGASEVARLKGFTAANPAAVLILCPKSVIQHWRNTLQASGIDNLRVLVINYDQSLKLLTQPAKAQAAKRKRTKNSNTANQGNPIVRWDIVLADEAHKCFIADTMVETSAGPIPIQAVTPGMAVLTKNHATGRLEFKPVLQTMKNVVPVTSLVRVNHVHGDFTATIDHPVWTNEFGYTSVESLLENSHATLRNLPERSDITEESHEDLFSRVFKQAAQTNFDRPKSTPASRSALRNMWINVSPTSSSVQVLQQQAFRREQARDRQWESGCSYVNLPTVWGGVSASLEESPSCEEVLLAQVLRRSTSAFGISKDEGEQSNVQSGCSCQDDCKHAGQNFSFSWRQRSIDKASANYARADWTSDGATYFDFKRMGTGEQHLESSCLLQSGLGTSGEQACNRDRRKDSQDITLEVLGSSQDRHTRASRLEGYSLLERGSAGRSPESEGDYRAVYNLEVEGNHNYFANGALVHNCKGIYTAQRAKAFARIARYNEAADKAPFVIWMSATMGQNPIDLGYMAPLIGQINGKPKMTLDEWGPYLEGEGYAVKPQKVGYAWATAKMNATEGERKHVAQVQRKDVERISAILFNPKAPSIRRLPTDIAGWPEQQRVPMGVEFDEEQQRLYQEAWLDFRSQMRLLLKGKNPQGALVAMLRFRQKASLLMVEPGLDHITDLLENGLQVAVSCQFLETIDRLRPLVEKAGYRTAEFSGRIQGDEREAERLKFQKGQAKVIFYTVAEAISLHAGEQLADGTSASKAPRANVILDIRFSGFESLQIEGRTHRDGQNSVTYYMYGESTIQKKLLKSLLQKMKNTSRLSGDTATEALDMVAELIEDAPPPALQLN